jgi:hypothetical protein
VVHSTINHDTRTDATTLAVDSSNNKGKLKKQTKAELIKTAGYAIREKNKSKSRSCLLLSQLKIQELEHAQALSKQKDLLKNKSDECNNLATMAQQHRRAANLSQHDADSQVATILEDAQFSRQDAVCKIGAAEVGALKAIRAERHFQQSKIDSTAKKHASFIQRLKSDHDSDVKQIQQTHCAALEGQASTHSNIITNINEDHTKEISKLVEEHQAIAGENDNKIKALKKQRDRHQEGEQSALVESQQLKFAHSAEIDQMKIDHAAEVNKVKRELRAALADEVLSSAKMVDEKEDEQVELMRTYHGMVEENADYRRELTATGKKMSTITATSARRLLDMREAKANHQRSADEVVKEKRRIE